MYFVYIQVSISGFLREEDVHTEKIRNCSFIMRWGGVVAEKGGQPKMPLMGSQKMP